MTFQVFDGVTKTIGLLLLFVNAQLNLGQGAAEAKSGFLFHTNSISRNSLPGGKPQTANYFCSVGIGAAIEAVINRPQFSRGRWGILIQTLSSSHTLYSHDAQKYFVPASNVKLLTTAAALHQMGSNFRIRTSVYGNGDGSLRVVGRGDPSITDTHLTELAQQLSRGGIRRVQQLIADDDYFHGPAVNPSWEWEDVQADYGAPINSLILNQNAVELKLLPQQLGQPVQVAWADPIEKTQWQIENESVTTQQSEATTINVSRDSAEPILRITGQLGIDSQPESVALAVVDPTEHFLQHFRRALATEGINVNADIRRYTQMKPIRVHPRPSAFAELAFVESPPLSQLLVETNQNSNNLYAEALLRTLGATSGTSEPTKSTLEMGLAAVKSTLTKLGVDPTGYILADGSGLSRQNLVSPEALVQTLEAMAHSLQASVYRSSLSVAGISGTLRNRFHNSAEGIVQAKTGTISGVVALSGYLDAPNYEPLVFSIIVNQSSQFDATTLRQAVDEVVLLLTRLHHC